MNVQQITDERLAGWKKKLAEENATPVVLIGIGQGHNSGAVVACIPENGLRDNEIAKLLRSVANQIGAEKN